MGLAGVLTAVLHYTRMEQEWQQNQVDYSDEVRLELIVYAGIVSIMLLTFSATIPAINIRELVERFQSQPAVQQAEDVLDRAFAGIRRPQRGNSPGGVGGSGIMPRSYLLGNPPELSERVMMQATVHVIDENGNETLPSAGLLQGTHWRGLSYDVYTGKGWALSEESQEIIQANQEIDLPPIAKPLQLAQTIKWEHDERIIRYTLGLPSQFDHEVTVSWRGLTDLSRVQGEPTTYTVQTTLPNATADELRAAKLDNIPPHFWHDTPHYLTLFPSEYTIWRKKSRGTMKRHTIKLWLWKSSCGNTLIHLILNSHQQASIRLNFSYLIYKRGIAIIIPQQWL